MKFLLQIVTKSGRTGLITDISRLPKYVFETPLLLLYTKGGSVPHLTQEVMEMVSEERYPLSISLPTTIHMAPAVVEFKKGIATFIGMKDHLIYCGVQDPAMVSPSGYNEKLSVSVWSKSGNRSLTADTYMDMMETFQPDMYQVLCDGDTTSSSSKKRMRKCVDRSADFLKECVQRHNDSKVLKNSSLLAVIEGGYSIRDRQESAKTAVQDPVFGFVIDGLHINGPEVEKITFSSISAVIQETVKVLPEEKPRIIHGCWNPDTVLNLVESGIDVFDSSYPYIVSERGSALVFCNQLDNDYTNKNSFTSTCGQENNDENKSSNNLLEETDDKIRENDKLVGCETKGTSLKSVNKSAETLNQNCIDEAYEISLKDDRYSDDFRPVMATCQCLCCKKHTRAYLHHLLVTKELLAPVLLSVHNLHHYLEFFKSIRTGVKEDKLWLLKNNIKLKMD